LNGHNRGQVSRNEMNTTTESEKNASAPEAPQPMTKRAPAKFGNFMGAIISTTTKSGTNQFHGSAFEFFRNNVLNANDWANNFNGAFRAAVRWNNFGGTLGGPILKNKLSFSLTIRASATIPLPAS
jgi:hypothetical protein